MQTIQALILGIIQGLTEFLPISSSGHLVFIPKLFGWSDQGLAFDAIIHLGTLWAVIIYFRKRLWGVVTLKSSESRKLGGLILLSIIPAALIAFFFADWLEQNVRSTLVIGIGLIFWGIVLWLADSWGKKVQSLPDLNWQKALFIGCAQAIALLPGTSRSGITITAGLFSKLTKKAAAEFAFLMSVPIIFLAGFKKLYDLMTLGFGDLTLGILLIGFVSSALSGFIAIWGLMKIIQKWSFKPFVVYRIIIGILILLFLI